ncbi:MAG TPA: TolC family protein [Gemmatimonadales bacterium]|jgi:NodT family efflux transporter outer membrane factor (OMF) lipoprotein|nr:TolC family protein [Gemmatimonadales bacterium]
MRRAALVGLIALAGCVSAPAYRPSSVALPKTFREVDPAQPISAPAAWAPAAAAPVEFDAGFWRRLGDTTLDRLMDQALRTNLDLQAAQARLRAARAARARAVLDLTPDGALAGGYTRRRFASASFPGASSRFPDEDVWDAGFDAVWEIDVFGRIRRTVRAHSALVAASREDLRGVTVTLAAELARAYFELRGAEEQLDVARRNAENQRRTLELTRERLEAGRGTAFDVERALAQLNVTLASIPAREAQVAAAQYRIGVLTGRPPTIVAGEFPPTARQVALPDTVAVGTPDSVLRTRPDVAAAERLAAAQAALASAARAEYLPRLSVGGNAGYTAADFDRLGNDGTFRYAVGPVLRWPLLGLGRIKADVSAARARADAARAEYGQIVLEAMEEVESSLARYRAARSRVEQLAAAAAASERAAELARMRFSEGIVDFLQVLDAERTQLESQDLLAQGRTEAATAYAALYQALGGP